MRGLIIHKFQIWKISPQIYVVHIFQKTLYKLSDIYVILAHTKKKKKKSGIYVIDWVFHGDCHIWVQTCYNNLENR